MAERLGLDSTVASEGIQESTFRSIDRWSHRNRDGLLPNGRKTAPCRGQSGAFQGSVTR